ncbi:MAG: hypothetical protein HOP28_12270 [Gemmatimonadales bacterium]|nr:hypothetical protein [Gemmatimonadales bacterium]
MSDKQATAKGTVKQDAGGKVIKKTFLLDAELWAATVAAASRLSKDGAAAVTVPNYVRGALEKRNAEVLHTAAA